MRVADAEDEVVVVVVVEVVRFEIDFELEAVNEADLGVTIEFVVVATTPSRSFVNESSACMVTTHIASKKYSRGSGCILRARQSG